jgi:hypothetical protein
MKSERDPWTRVKDESELREGMAVQLRPCALCSRVETQFLLGTFLSVAWVNTGCCTVSRFSIAIGEGRLYRLADDQLADDAEPATVVRGREMERAR